MQRCQHKQMSKRLLSDIETASVCSFLRTTLKKEEAQDVNCKVQNKLRKLERICNEHGFTCVFDFLKQKCLTIESNSQGEVMYVIEQGERQNIILIKGNVKLEGEQTCIKEAMKVIVIEGGSSQCAIINDSEKSLIILVSDQLLSELVEEIKIKEEERAKIKKIINKHTLLSKCTSRQLEKIVQSSKFVTIKKDQILYSSKDPTEGYFIILKGELSLILPPSRSNSFNYCNSNKNTRTNQFHLSPIAVEKNIFLKTDQSSEVKLHNISPSHSKDERSTSNTTPLQIKKSKDQILSKSPKITQKKETNQKIKISEIDEELNCSQEDNSLSSLLLNHSQKNSTSQIISILTEGTLVGIEDLLLNKPTRSSTVMGSALFTELLQIKLDDGGIFSLLDQGRIQELQDSVFQQIGLRKHRAQSHLKKNVSPDLDKKSNLEEKTDGNEIKKTTRKAKSFSRTGSNHDARSPRGRELSPEKTKPNSQSNQKLDPKNISQNQSFLLNQKTESSNIIAKENNNPDAAERCKTSPFDRTKNKQKTPFKVEYYNNTFKRPQSSLTVAGNNSTRFNVLIETPNERMLSSARMTQELLWRQSTKKQAKKKDQRFHTPTIARTENSNLNKTCFSQMNNKERSVDHENSNAKKHLQNFNDVPFTKTDSENNNGNKESIWKGKGKGLLQKLLKMQQESKIVNLMKIESKQISFVEKDEQIKGNENTHLLSKDDSKAEKLSLLQTSKTSFNNNKQQQISKQQNQQQPHQPLHQNEDTLKKQSSATLLSHHNKQKEHISGYTYVHPQIQQPQLLIDESEETVKKQLKQKMQLLSKLSLPPNLGDEISMFELNSKKSKYDYILNKINSNNSASNNKSYQFQEETYLLNTKYQGEQTAPSSFLLFDQYKKKKLHYFKRASAFSLENNPKNKPNLILPLQISSSAAVKNNKRKLKMSRKSFLQSRCIGSCYPSGLEVLQNTSYDI